MINNLLLTASFLMLTLFAVFGNDAALVIGILSFLWFNHRERQADGDKVR